MPLSRVLMEPLQKLAGTWECQVTATRAWALTFFSNGPPPIALALMKGQKGKAFFEELVKLSDIKRVLDARAILVAPPGYIDSDGIQLATNSGVYVVFDGDSKNLEEALRGAEVPEVNELSREGLSSKKNRSVSSECRTLELDLISKRWMTRREVEEQLQWRFESRTVRTQIRSLQRQGKICLCGRTNTGEGLLGTPGGRYRVRPDLSPPTVRALLSREIADLLRTETRALAYQEIAERLGVKAHITTAALRGLAKRGVVERKGGGWALKKSD
jgi:predicted DNA-binding transcriptional regulator